MTSRPELRYLLTAVSAEKDRRKKLVGLRVLSMLRHEDGAEPTGERVLGDITHQFGEGAAQHARSLLRGVGLV